MATLKQIMRDYGPEYVRRFGKTMPDQHRKAIDAIVRCRTEHYGALLFRCSQCGHRHTVMRSCGNRHCPNCQGGKTRQWLAKRLTEQLPVNHFLITFTMPEAIRTFIRSHQRQCYGAMFDASSQTMKKLVRDDRFIGADLAGFSACFTPGAARCPIIPTSTMWFQPGQYPKQSASGIRAAMTSFCPCGPCQRSLRQNFTMP